MYPTELRLRLWICRFGELDQGKAGAGRGGPLTGLRHLQGGILQTIAVD